MRKPFLLPNGLFALASILTVTCLVTSEAVAAPTTGNLIRTYTNGSDGLPSDFTENFALFGSAIVPVGDIDQDGNMDLAAGGSAYSTNGGPLGQGGVFILFLNADGTVKSHTTIANGQGGIPAGTIPAGGSRFGGSLAAIGDLDGDGVTELAVGSPESRVVGNERGTVYILFLNSDGTVKKFTTITDGLGGFSGGILDDFDWFGNSVTSLGDFDGDGVVDLAVGASNDDTGGNNRGAVYLLYLKQDGTVKAWGKIEDGNGSLTAGTIGDNDLFGTSVANIGDWDGNGVPDLAVGAKRDDTGAASAGAVYILFLRADGLVLSHTKIADGTGGLAASTIEASDFFGLSVAKIPDLDGDGDDELLVGHEREDTGGTERGAAHVLLMNTDGTVQSQTKIADGVNGIPANTLEDGNFFGASVGYLGDINQDGLPDIGIGATWKEVEGENRGAVFAISVGDLPLEVTTTDDELDTPSTDGKGVSLREAIRDAKADPAFSRIHFHPSLSGETIVLGSPIDIEGQAVEISSESLDDPVTVSGGDTTLILEIQSDGSLTLKCTKLTDGSGTLGGAVNNEGLFLATQCTFQDNSASLGGGFLYNTGTCRIGQSTIAGNGSLQEGGAILQGNAGAESSVELHQCTLTQNTAVADGGAVWCTGSQSIFQFHRCTVVGNTSGTQGGGYARNGVMNFRDIIDSTILAGNTAPAGPDVAGEKLTLDTFVGGDPMLASLGNYGGKTLTMPPLPGSPVINALTYDPSPGTDQRGEGFLRARSGGIDTGASEALEVADVQPDNTIGEKVGKQKGNNTYNSTGAGQKVKVKLRGKKKFKTFFSVQNDGSFPNTISLRSNSPNKRTLKLKVFRLTGGRTNVTSALLRGGLAIADLAPGESVLYRGDYKRKSTEKNARGKIRFTSTSSLLGNSDTVQATVKSLRD